MISDKYTELLRKIETEEKDAEFKQECADYTRQYIDTASKKRRAGVVSMCAVYDEEAKEARSRLRTAQKQMEALLTQAVEADAYVGATLRYGYNESRIQTFEKLLEEKTISLHNVGTKTVPQKKLFFTRKEPGQEEKFEQQRESYRKTISKFKRKIGDLRKQQIELKAFIDANAAEYERKRKEAEEAAKNSPDAQAQKAEEEKRKFEAFGGASWY